MLECGAIHSGRYLRCPHDREHDDDANITRAQPCRLTSGPRLAISRECAAGSPRLRAQSERSLDFAIDTMMLERAESYFKVETGLTEVERMVTLIEEELDDVRELTHAQRLEARLEFIEDRFEDFDSEIHQRPKRRRRKINLFDFFKKATGSGDVAASQGEINSHQEAYEALGL